jgi:flagellar hook-associated protein 3 FlgL
MPISTRVYNDIAMSTLNRITGDIQGIQQRIATGRNIIKTSDNPAVGAKISFTKDQKILLYRFNSNIDRAQLRLSQAESAVETGVNILQRVYELGVQARNDTYNAGDRKVIAMEVRNLKDQIQHLANSRDTNGQYIFAGYKVNTKPFVADENGVIVHSGDRGVHNLQISDNQKIATSLDGADVFMRVPQGEEVGDIFSSLDEMIVLLEDGKMEDANLEKINKALDHFTLQQTKLGSQMNRAELQREVNEKRLLLINEDISNLEDADIAKLVTELQAKLVSRNAAQQSFIKIAQDNLFNYIR